MIIFTVSSIKYYVDTYWAVTYIYLHASIVIGYNHSVDWWSLGVLAYELVRGILLPPFCGSYESVIFKGFYTARQVCTTYCWNYFSVISAASVFFDDILKYEWFAWKANQCWSFQANW